MAKKTKLFFCICLLPLALTQFMGGAFILEWRLSDRHNERDIEIRAKGEAYKNITLSIPEYQKAQTREHEIQWQGRMYDVARVVILKDSAQLLFIDDLEEDNLLIEIEAFFSGNPTSSSDGLSCEWVKIGLLPYLVPIMESVALLDFRPFRRLTFPSIFSNPSSPELPASSPPPRSKDVRA